MLGSPLAFIMFASSDPGMDVDVTSRILMALSFVGAQRLYRNDGNQGDDPAGT